MLNGVFREVTGEQKLDEIAGIFTRANCCIKNHILKKVSQRHDQEIENPEFETSWRDLTSVYPDKFDGDNISLGWRHSCKLEGPADNPRWLRGQVCHSINALIWIISGYYQEYEGRNS